MSTVINRETEIKDDLQTINVADKSNTPLSFFDWLDSITSKEKGKSFFNWLHNLEDTVGTIKTNKYIN